MAEFPLHLSRHPIIVGPKGATLKRISAANAVRITVPSEKEAAAQQQQQHGWPSSSSSSLRDKNLVVQVRGLVVHAERRVDCVNGMTLIRRTVRVTCRSLRLVVTAAAALQAPSYLPCDSFFTSLRYHHITPKAYISLVCVLSLVTVMGVWACLLGIDRADQPTTENVSYKRVERVEWCHTHTSASLPSRPTGRAWNTFE